MSQTNKFIPVKEVKVTKAELAILEDIRRVKFGRVVIFISDGKPFRKEMIEQKRIDPEDGGSAGDTPKPTGIEI
ncbi:MAG: hypothetical protein PHQ59_01930 [Candidatus Daviesbacteria bacterium]|nr:hypothetical protein [Candidatus Daviesbacteria bacterium]